MQKYLRMDFDSIRDQYSNDLAGSMELASISTYRKDCLLYTSRCV